MLVNICVKFCEDSLYSFHVMDGKWTERWMYPLSCVMFVCFAALRPKSTAVVMAGRSVHLTTLFPGQA